MNTKAIVLVVGIVLAVALATQQDGEDAAWQKWTHEFGKTYATSDQLAQARAAFHQHHEAITRLQASPAHRHMVFGHGPFSDRPMDQAKDMFHRVAALPPTTKKIKPTAAEMNAEVPDYFDWYNYKVFAPIRNQGQCGSCWAFSATTVLEAQIVLNGRQPLQLSKQVLLDCDQNCWDSENCDHACAGGLYLTAWDWMMKMGGAVAEADYPDYEAHQQQCRLNLSSFKPAVKVQQILQYDSPDEEALRAYIMKHGPVSIAIGGGANLMHLYKGGLFEPSLCADWPDHEVVLHGWGPANYLTGTPAYWIVRNSWGPAWGEAGYFRLPRGVNACNMTLAIATATIA